jgi:TPR repeat protein
MNKPIRLPDRSGNKHSHRSFRWFVLPLLIVLSFIPAGCNTTPPLSEPAKTDRDSNSGSADGFLVVDCLLPGKIRRLGTSVTYLTQRRPIKTTASDCEIRGGEYTAYDRGGYATALKIWLPKAQEGDPKAQTYVGEIYEKGLGLAPDYGGAAKWYRKAADQGYSRAQVNLGYLYEKGLGVRKDLKTALNLYRQASGLSDELAFSSGIQVASTQARTDVTAQEIDSLKSELSRSRTEAEALRRKLAEAESQIRTNQSKLQQTLEELDEARKQLRQKQSAPPSTDHPDALKPYEQAVQAKEAEVRRQQQELERLERTFQEKNDRLVAQLTEAKQQAESDGEALAKVQLEKETLQAKLVSTETRLQQLKLDYRLKQQAGNPSAAVDRTQELEALKMQLKRKEQALETQRTRIAKLEQERDNLTREKDRLAADAANGRHQTAEADRLARQQAESKRQLQAAQQRIERIEREKRSLAAEKKRLQKASQKMSNSREEDLKKLKQKIKQQEREKQKIQKALASTKSPPAPTQQSTADEISGPEIEIIDPPLTVVQTRGVPTIKLRSAAPSREITGRALAPAGLMTLTVNDQSVAINEANLFKTTVKTTAKKTPINVTLIDRLGAKASIDFVLISMVKEAAPSGQSGRPGVDFGSYHALVIGNNRYAHLPSLDTPISDAKTVAAILKKKYGFRTKVLTNANRYRILSSMNNLRKRLNEKDNLLIYYAGHGELDKVNQRGQWLPVDAEMENTANWISTDAITDILNTMSVKHIIVVADSCYSGALSRTALARLEPGMSEELKAKWLKTMVKTQSRTVLTSGGLKPVMDAGADGHSVFAKALIDALRKNQTVMEGQTLFQQVYTSVKKGAENVGFEQTPQYGPIRHTGHESGDFFFVPL